MQTFDQSLMALLRSGLVTYEEALRQATNPDDFALRVSGIAGTSDSKWDGFEQGAEPAPARAQPAASPPRPPQGAAARAPAPPAPAVTAADDEFKIERF